jgi:hypothetical protein
MKLQFLELAADERRLHFEQAAIQRNVSPVLVEKDFWVCWLLAVLFESEFADSLVFKGGTSLSKVFGVIDRFSEDIDLSLSPEFLQLPDVGTSRNQANKWMKNAEAACGHARGGADRACPGGHCSIGAGTKCWPLVRVRERCCYELARAAVPLPIDATTWVRLP